VSTPPTATHDSGTEPGTRAGGVAVFPRVDAERSVPAAVVQADDGHTHHSGENSSGEAGGDRKPFLYASLPDWYGQ